MSLTTTDVAADFDLFDWVTSVTYQRRDLSGNVVDNYTISALKRATRGSMVALGDAVEVIDTARWHLQSSDFPENTTPRRGDRIVSATYGTWEVVSDDIETLASRYVCETRRIT